VTGEGEIKVRPDVAILDLDVVTTAKTAQEASEQNAQRMQSVIAALKVLGLASADLQTVGYDVMPVFDYDEKSPTYGKILSYRVSARLRARVEVDQAGQAIDAAIAAGANMTAGLRFGLRDETAVRSRALKAAVKAARRDADAIAESLAVKIRKVEAVEANMGGGPILYREMPMAKAASTPIEPGTIEIHANVRVVYRYA
jgi:uncharacterized protein YggE